MEVNGGNIPQRVVVYREHLKSKQFNQFADIEIEIFRQVLEPLSIELAYITI